MTDFLSETFINVVDQPPTTQMPFSGLHKITFPHVPTFIDSTPITPFQQTTIGVLNKNSEKVNPCL